MSRLLLAALVLVVGCSKPATTSKPQTSSGADDKVAALQKQLDEERRLRAEREAADKKARDNAAAALKRQADDEVRRLEAKVAADKKAKQDRRAFQIEKLPEHDRANVQKAISAIDSDGIDRGDLTVLPVIAAFRSYFDVTDKQLADAVLAKNAPMMPAAAQIKAWKASKPQAKVRICIAVARIVYVEPNDAFGIFPEANRIAAQWHSEGAASLSDDERQFMRRYSSLFPQP